MRIDYRWGGRDMTQDARRNAGIDGLLYSMAERYA